MSDLSPLSVEERKSNFGPSGPLMAQAEIISAMPEEMYARCVQSLFF